MPFAFVEGSKAHYVHRQPIPARHPAVLFIHGAGGTHRHWLYQARSLPQAPSCAVDLPGHGRSLGTGYDSIAAYADWLIAFMNAVGLPRAVLVGHSMGGAIALDVALRFPAWVAGLGLVATGAKLRVVPAILEGIQRDPEAAVELISTFAYGPEASPEIVRLGRHQMRATPPAVLYRDMLACDQFDARDRLGAIRAPSMVLCGTQDAMTPAKYSSYLRDHVQGAALHLVEGAGHMVMVERPEAVLNALNALLLNL